MSFQHLYNNYKWLSDNVIEKIIEIEIYNRIDVIDAFIDRVKEGEYPSYPPRNIVQKLEKIDSKLNSLIAQESDRDNRIGKLGSEIDRLKKAPSAASAQKEVETLKDANKQLSNRLSEIEHEHLALKSRLENAEKENIGLANRLTQLESNYQELLKRVEALDKPETDIPVPIPFPETPIPKAPTKKTIEHFYLNNAEGLNFANNRIAIKKAFAKALDIQALLNCIQNANIDADNKKAYLMILENYHKQLDRAVAKFSYDDEEDLSERASSTFFDLLGKHILNNLAVALYRSLEYKLDDAVLLIVDSLNNYLVGCGVTTVSVKPNEKITKEIASVCSIMIEHVDDRAKDDHILEVEKLPYYLDYIDEDGDKDKLYSNGKITVGKAK